MMWGTSHLPQEGLEQTRVTPGAVNLGGRSICLSLVCFKVSLKSCVAKMYLFFC